ncbi:nicotinamide-nucleotide amidohydrolase family protein [Peredibacter sp. HCB2-198]|uniref:nicotinamide-nucleotide amidohydrolase family protein n=1 Tax=Peredibacter sp. HCB2-198 TaxID=3383025 RepID=UPI0038B47059
MKIGYLVIGSEVLDGKISDTNTKLLADFLRAYHLEIHQSMVARDERLAILEAMKVLYDKCDLIVTSGGLGPTKDDITKETLAEFFGSKITYSEMAHQVAEANYKRFDRPFPGKDHGYSYLPENFVPLNNSTGFAPGFFSEQKGKFLFSAPGVPREFKSMLEEHLIKLVSSKLDQSVVLGTVIIRTKKVPEEKIFGEVDPTLWDKLEKFGEVSSLPILMGVDIGVKIRAKSQSELAEKVSAVKAVIEASPIKSAVWSYGPESLEERIVTVANHKKIRFGFAESATGGLCSNRITNISGSSQCFMGSIVCYDEKVKEHVLGVSAKTLQECTAVSIKCAEEMAHGLKERLSVDIAISITGFAGPGGGNDKFPVGSVCIGRAKNHHISAESFHFKGDREILKQRFSQAALHVLLEELENFA